MKTEDAIPASLFIILISFMISVLTFAFINDPIARTFPEFGDSNSIFEFSMFNLQKITVIADHKDPVTVTFRSTRPFKIRNIQTNDVIDAKDTGDRYFMTASLQDSWLLESSTFCYVTSHADSSNKNSKVLSVITSQEAIDQKLTFLFTRVYPLLFVLAQAGVWISWLVHKFRTRPLRSSSSRSSQS